MQVAPEEKNGNSEVFLLGDSLQTPFPLLSFPSKPRLPF
jgi:hypothetical protein